MDNNGPRVLLGHDMPSESSKKIEIILIVSLVLPVLLFFKVFVSNL